MREVTNNEGEFSVVKRVVEKLVQQAGFDIVTPSRLPSADVVATKGNVALVMECKAQRPSAYLGFDSLAQVLSVARGFKADSNIAQVHPIVMGTFNVSEAVKASASKAGISVIPIADMAEEKLEQALSPLVVNLDSAPSIR